MSDFDEFEEIERQTRFSVGITTKKGAAASKHGKKNLDASRKKAAAARRVHGFERTPSMPRFKCLEDQ